MTENAIRVGTKIDLSGIKKGIKELEGELKRAEKEYADYADYVTKREAELRQEIAKGGPGGEQAQQRLTKLLKDRVAVQKDLNAEINAYQKKLSEAVAYHERFSGATDAGKQLDSAVADDKFISSINTQEKYNSLLAQTKAKMAAMEAHAARIAERTGASARDILRQSDAYQDAANKAKLLETRAKDIKQNIWKAKKETKGLSDETKRGVRGFGKMHLMMMGIMMATRAISAATQEYIATNTKLEGQLNTLKSLWGQVLGPVIEGFINLLIKAISYVNEFVVALTGINFIARANEAALKKQAKATSNAAKAAQLAGFDEQTKLTDPSSGSSDAVTLLDASMDNLPAFVEKMKAQLIAGDWYGAGQTAGDALMDGIESVDWESVGTKIATAVGNAVSFALGFMLSLDPITLMESAIRLITGLMEGLSATIQNLDWSKIGSDFVDLLLASLVAGLMYTNPYATIVALIFTPQGRELTTASAELIGSIAGALLSALVGAAKRIGEIGVEIWNTIKAYFDDYVDWEGTPGEIIEGLFNGIVDALKGVGDWIYNNIWIPFRDGFKEAFDIHSPSKKMEEFGGLIIDGLCGGITGAIDKVKQACTDIWEAIKEKFSDVGTWFKEKFTDAWQKVKDVFSTGGKIFDGIKEGIADTFKTIVNGLIDGINKVIKVPFNAINGMLNTIRGIEVLGVSPFKGLWSYNPLSVPQIPKLALGGIVNRPGRGVPAIIGEAGAEAVLPLENNTEWMDILADKIGGNVTIPIYMDGKKIATYVVDIQKKKAFAMNGV